MEQSGGRRRWTRTISASGLVASLLVGVASPAAGAAPSVWTSVPTQYVSGQNFIFQALAVPKAGDVWAIGYRSGLMATLS